MLIGKEQASMPSGTSQSGIWDIIGIQTRHRMIKVVRKIRLAGLISRSIDNIAKKHTTSAVYTDTSQKTAGLDCKSATDRW